MECGCFSDARAIVKVLVLVWRRDAPDPTVLPPAVAVAVAMVELLSISWLGTTDG
jgi:hypothetical protein